MYRKIEENDDIRYEFDGDLEAYLINKGISREHIHKMQTKTLEREFGFYYDYEMNEKEEFVPVEKIAGTSRCASGKSVFENVRVMYQGERDPGRFSRWFDCLEENTLTEIYKTYEDLFHPIYMSYHEDEDMYYVTSDGNHRALTAMLFGAPLIKARVTTAHVNTENKNKYDTCKCFYKEFCIEQITRTKEGLYTISYNENGILYEVYGYYFKKYNVYDVIEELKRDILEDKRIAEKINRVPSFLKKIAICLYNNKRALQYINKERIDTSKDKVVNLYIY